jgi:NDP-sugar pyrophosphorylase family protein
VKAALIAAGAGERLRAAGLQMPKPLVAVAGVPLIDRVLDAVAAAGIREVACIFNSAADAVEAHCLRAHTSLTLQVVRRDTPSSMESLFALQPHLTDDRFLLLTVDAVFGPALLPSFLSQAARVDAADGVLGVHEFVDDEKPLRVRLDERRRIVGLGEDAAESPLITAGVYVLSPRIFAEVAAARRASFTALRQFLRHLVRRGYRLYGAPVEKTVDVDRPEDIAVAEAFVASGFAA